MHSRARAQRDRYVKRMMAHQQHMASVKPSISLDAPVAAFGGGKYRTPQAAGQTGKVQERQQESFREVREAFRR